MRRPRWRLVLATLGIGALTACAGIPESGPVTRVNIDQGTNQSTVRYSPTGPARNASPQQIIRGYLDAMLAYPVTTGTATAFLTPEAARTWNSAGGVTIYAQPDVSLPVIRSGGAGQTADETADIALHVVEDASLDKQGRFTRINAGKGFDFHLVKSGGQWRIGNPPPGFLVDRKFFGDYYRPFNDYYFDRSGKRLVADPIYVPVGDQLSTALVSSLLQGPGNLLAGTARTYLPAHAQLRTSIPLRTDGLADVQLRDDLSGLSNMIQGRLSAQMIWTLRQVSEVTAVRITGGDNVVFPGDRGVQPIDSWQAFGPRFGDGGFYGLQKNRVVKIDGHTVTPVDRSWGKDARGAVSLAVDSDSIAAVGRNGSTLLLGSFLRSGVTTIAGHDILPPQWDDAGNAWFVDSPAGSTRVRLTNGKTTRVLPAGTLRTFSVQSFSLSPDGARYALITKTGTGNQVYVGDILRDAADNPVSLTDPQPVRIQSPTFTHPRSISWSTESSVTFLADDNVVGAQIFEARIDGSQVSGGTSSVGPLLADVPAVALATVGGANPVRYVTDAKDRIWLLGPNSSWELLSQPGVTALVASTTTPTG